MAPFWSKGNFTHNFCFSKVSKMFSHSKLRDRCQRSQTWGPLSTVPQIWRPNLGTVADGPQDFMSQLGDCCKWSRRFHVPTWGPSPKVLKIWRSNLGTVADSPQDFMSQLGECRRRSPTFYVLNWGPSPTLRKIWCPNLRIVADSLKDLTS